jgi:hypothetical protein
MSVRKRAWTTSKGAILARLLGQRLSALSFIGSLLRGDLVET